MIYFQDVFNKILLILSKQKKKVIAFKYPHYKKVFVNENPKTGFPDMEKLQKIRTHIKMLYTNISLVYIYIVISD